MRRKNDLRDVYINGHWMFPEQLTPKEHVGFVYIIRDLRSGHMYIGKKQMRGTGRLNKGQESDWRTYTGSCEALNKEINRRSVYEFSFVVLEQYRTKGTLAFAETWSLSICESPTKPEFYNTTIERVSWRCTEAITQRHRDRLLKVVAGASIGDSVI